MLVLYTDFGHGSYYGGQMEAVCRAMAPAVSCVTLTHDAPRYHPRAAAVLLAALVADMPQQATFICVVDPAVGSARRPLVGRSGSRWFVGPDNGLMVAAAGDAADWFELDWRPEQLSATFHGRDLFAPAAVKLSLGKHLAMRAIADPVGLDWGRSWSRVVDIDAFGNVITGLAERDLPDAALLTLGGQQISHARCFSSVAAGALFWYRNSIGLIEVAANRAAAAPLLQVACGDEVTWEV